MNRSIAVLVVCAGLLVYAAPAIAGESTTTSVDTTAASGSTSADSSTTSTSAPAPATVVPATSTEVPAATTTQVPATTTEIPAITTDVPATTTTDVPATTTAEVPVTTTTTTVPTTTETTTAPVVGTEANTECLVDCIPQTDVDGCVDSPSCVPETVQGAGSVPRTTTAIGAGRSLPFTGIEDVFAPLLLAMTIVLGGVVAWRWAQLREAVAAASTRGRELPAQAPQRSGYDGALRHMAIEQRARQVFAPRVA